MLTAQAQWTYSNATVLSATSATATNWADPQFPMGFVDNTTQSKSSFDVVGSDILECGTYSQRYFTKATCPSGGAARSKMLSELTVNGQEATFDWTVMSRASYFCEPWVPFYIDNGAATLSFNVALGTTNVPVGTPLLIYYRWEQSTFNHIRQEGGQEDNGFVKGIPGNHSLMINNQQLFDPGYFFNFNNVPGFKVIPSTSGSFTMLAGDIVTIAFSADLLSDIAAPGELDQSAGSGDRWSDYGGAWSIGSLRISIGTFPTTPVAVPAALPLFSLDIGSDKEFSDPAIPNDGAFDPGDMYAWNGPVIPFPGFDGILNDFDIFGFDPQPAVSGLMAAPACSVLQIPGLVSNYFDLDGSDNMELNLSLLIPAGSPAPVIPFSPSIECVSGIDYLLLSFDEDDGEHYAGTQFGCSIPVESLSPRGKTSEQDEVVGMYMIPDPGFPNLYTGTLYRFSAEGNVHSGLFPNPTGTSALNNDDVDALDVVIDPASVGNPLNPITPCNNWYFSADHEATSTDMTGLNLQPGAIYQQLAPGNFVKVIDPVLHLGLTPEVDIDAFEFVWLVDQNGLNRLALVFSVDEFDWLVPGKDESGGLAANQLYASFMDGASFPLLNSVVHFHDIDAIASWHKPFYPQDAIGGITTGIEAIVTEKEERYLLKNYPNPFSNDTSFEFHMEKPGNGELEIYNNLGQLVFSKTLEELHPGTNQFRWTGKMNNGVEIPSGVYFATMTISGQKIFSAGVVKVE